MKCALLSNSNIESLSRRVDTRHEMFIAEGYGSWIQELANPTSAMWRFGPAAVVLLLDGTELLHGYEGAKEDTLTWYCFQRSAFPQKRNNSAHLPTQIVQSGVVGIAAC
jgi:predicted enzyme involved in methoxymalonyl-ACP biosynthesis